MSWPIEFLVGLYLSSLGREVFKGPIDTAFFFSLLDFVDNFHCRTMYREVRGKSVKSKKERERKMVGGRQFILPARRDLRDYVINPTAHQTLILANHIVQRVSNSISHLFFFFCMNRRYLSSLHCHCSHHRCPTSIRRHTKTNEFELRI